MQNAVAEMNECRELKNTVEIQSLATSKVFQVNGHRLKPFYEGVQAKNVQEVELKDLVYMDK